VPSLLQDREGVLGDVRLSDGRRRRVWDIARGCDAGESWAAVDGEPIDQCLTEEAVVIGAARSDEVLLGPTSAGS
jgi:hypothetical protein